jgi:hypothetical protein
VGRWLPTVRQELIDTARRVSWQTIALLTAVTIAIALSVPLNVQTSYATAPLDSDLPDSRRTSQA